jgi:hypothetical protein
MIYVRDDDVLMYDKNKDKALRRFIKVHEKIRQLPDLLIHVPTIVVKDTSRNTEVIDYLKNETEAGRMAPEIHGWNHIDYGKLDYKTVRKHLQKCKTWMLDSLGVEATKWYTPWGASQEHLHKAAKDEGLELVDCSNINKLRGRYGVTQRITEGYDIETLYDGQEWFMHFWESDVLDRLDKILSYFNDR